MRRKLLYLISWIVIKLGFEFPPLPTVSAIITSKRKILVIEVDKNQYTLPGGMVKRKEKLTEGLKREVFEETGGSVHNITFFKEYACQVQYPTINFTYLGKIKYKNLIPSSEGIPVFKDLEEIQDKLIYLDNRLAIKDYLQEASQKY